MLRKPKNMTNFVIEIFGHDIRSANKKQKKNNGIKHESLILQNFY